jgi:hypothetical protein
VSTPCHQKKRRFVRRWGQSRRLPGLIRASKGDDFFTLLERALCVENGVGLQALALTWIPAAGKLPAG